MKTLFNLIAMLLTPRRSFAYRQIEVRLATAVAERDSYRDKWEGAMHYIAYESGKPRFAEADTPPTFTESSQAERTVSPIQEEQDKFETEKNHRYYAFLEEQKRQQGAANDVEVSPTPIN